MTRTETLDPDGTHAVACRCLQCIDAGDDPGSALTIADCVCVLSCEDDPDTSCYLSGTFHVHKDADGHCYVHPDADKS